MSTVSAARAQVIPSCIVMKCVNTPSPSEWWTMRCAAWWSVDGAPTTCTTGTCSAKLPAIALIADSSPTPNAVASAAIPRSRP